MLSDVNRNPRRWVDESGRVLVIEGWHPSEPSAIGYNVIVDGDWLGTFGTLDGAAVAAGACARLGGRTVTLRPGNAGSARRAETHLRVVRPLSAKDT